MLHISATIDLLCPDDVVRADLQAFFNSYLENLGVATVIRDTYSGSEVQARFDMYAGDAPDAPEDLPSPDALPAANAPPNLPSPAAV